MNQITEEKENGALPAIMDDKLINIADQAERRIEAVKKIKQVALKVTNANDWVDQNGRPYLQASGSEKVARLFGISWRIDEPRYEETGEGHFTYTYKGVFSLQDVTIEAVGSRSSKDPFFSRSHGKDIPASEIDRPNVRKAAYTNLLGNGITRLLGIRNLDYNDLAETGITKSMVTRFEYKGKGSKPSQSGKKGATVKDKDKDNDALHGKSDDDERLSEKGKTGGGDSLPMKLTKFVQADRTTYYKIIGQHGASSIEDILNFEPEAQENLLKDLRKKIKVDGIE